MRIGEIAEKTGLSISNIRFYEKKGLIGPDREKESKYRNYTDGDLDRIKRILLYRKMDISVEMIGKILDGDISAEDALEQQLMDLRVKQQTLQNSIDLCQKVIDDKAFDNADTDFYLNYIKEEEAKGRVFEKIDDLLDDFSIFTQFDRFVIFPKVWMNRVAIIVWCLFFVSVPVVGIVDDVLDENGFSPACLVFWILWTLFFVFSFIRFREGKK